MYRFNLVCTENRGSNAGVQMLLLVAVHDIQRSCKYLTLLCIGWCVTRWCQRMHSTLLEIVIGWLNNSNQEFHRKSSTLYEHHWKHHLWQHHREHHLEQHHREHHLGQHHREHHLWQHHRKKTIDDNTMGSTIYDTDSTVGSTNNIWQYHGKHQTIIVSMWHHQVHRHQY